MVSVDIVVPCYNYARFLRHAVESAMHQDDVEVRVLIIDDCSTDLTPDVGRELTHEFAGVTFRRHAENKGHVATFNEGIAELTGDYFLLLSADDYLLPGSLGRAVRLMEAHKEISFVFGRAFFSANERPLQPWVPLTRGIVHDGDTVLSGRRFVELSSALNIVPTPTAVVRTSVQLAAGGYRPELPHTGDMEMWLRLAAYGSVGYIDADQAVYRLHGTNMSIAYEGIDDLEARRKALNIFFADGAKKMDPSGALQRECLHRFSGEAFRQARMALNRGEANTARQFRDYGLAVSPTARLSLGWVRLLAKQAMRRQSLTAIR
ncbi:glycosyltransferase family A protein [Devosia sp. 2618]|uniref:glycosyltransferase family 2 protein n=1 Tax=Devosia sp. 2618 TaxID=3156454 RepID=UPI0033975DFD